MASSTYSVAFTSTRGVDIRAAVGTAVYAIEGGTVFKLVQADDPYDNTLAIATTSDTGWNYAHLDIETHLAADYMSAVADGKTIAVEAGRLLGFVAV